MVNQWKRVKDALVGPQRTAPVGQPGDLRIGSLLDDPALQQALGIDTTTPTAAAPVQPDGRTASMLRAALFEHAA